MNPSRRWPKAVLAALAILPVALFYACSFAASAQAKDEPAASAAPGKFVLHARRRVATKAGSGRYHAVTETVEWEAKKTAVVICDMWDKHWCAGATKRVGEMAPRMNEVVAKARQQGALIIHCPSDTLDFYKDTAARLLAQQAPVVETKRPLERWCRLDPDREGKLPIDDSDGGCDDAQPSKTYKAWTREHPAIPIGDNDVISDNGNEVYSFLKQHGIKNLLIMGVHTNMCVCNRSFAIKQMTKWGIRCILVRDLTDSMYNPKKAPFVSHDEGTELVIRHIEKYWCPSIVSSDLRPKDKAVR